MPEFAVVGFKHFNEYADFELEMLECVRESHIPRLTVLTLNKHERNWSQVPEKFNRFAGIFLLDSAAMNAAQDCGVQLTVVGILDSSDELVHSCTNVIGPGPMAT